MALITNADLMVARQAHESIMTATGVIRLPGDGWAFNPDTNQSEPAPGVIVYEGIMRVQRVNQAREIHAAAQDIVVGTHACAVPWGTTGLEPGCTVNVTTSADPALNAGTTLTITDVEQSTILTARRFWATDVRGQPA